MPFINYLDAMVKKQTFYLAIAITIVATFLVSTYASYLAATHRQLVISTSQSGADEGDEGGGSGNGGYTTGVTVEAVRGYNSYVVWVFANLFTWGAGQYGDMGAEPRRR